VNFTEISNMSVEIQGPRDPTWVGGSSVYKVIVTLLNLRQGTANYSWP
jgi:hypothetical protein